MAEEGCLKVFISKSSFRLGFNTIRKFFVLEKNQRESIYSISYKKTNGRQAPIYHLPIELHGI